MRFLFIEKLSVFFSKQEIVEYQRLFFYYSIGIVKDKTKFYALDGDHDAILEDELISIKMKDVTEVKEEPDCFFLNTGVPHYVTFVDSMLNFFPFKIYFILLLE